MNKDEPALAQLMFYLSHDLEIPDSVKKDVLKQYSRYLLQAPSDEKANLESAFFGSGNYAKEQWTHKRRVFFYKYLNRRIAEQKRDNVKPKKTQDQILLEVMPQYMHGDSSGRLTLEAIKEGRRRWNKEQEECRASTG